MKDSSSLSVDPSSPDDPVEKRFFQQGVDQEGTPKEETLDFDDQARRQRLFIWIGGGATTLCALGLLLLMGRPEPLVPPMTEPVAARPAPSAPPSALPPAPVLPSVVAPAPVPRPLAVPPTAPPVAARTTPPIATIPTAAAAPRPPAAAPATSVAVPPAATSAPATATTAGPALSPVTRVAPGAAVAAPPTGAVPPAVGTPGPAMVAAPSPTAPASSIAPRGASTVAPPAASTVARHAASTVAPVAVAPHGPMATPAPTTGVPLAAPARATAERSGVSREFKRLEQACRRAFGQRRYQEVRDSCARAFDAKPDAADLAALIAETEFDHGRGIAALSWARKAVAVNPNLANVYVFIGSAEQQSGHAQAAKTAYLKYLELAPKGRYAHDVRAVMHGL
jgi:hypothetical protein